YGHGFEIQTISVSNSGKFLASASRATKLEHAGIRIWDTVTWKQICELSNHTLTITRLRFSRTDKYLVSVSRDRGVCVWDVEGWKKVEGVEKAHGRIVWDVSWSYEDGYFVTGSRDKSIKVWETKGFKSVCTEKFEDAVTSVDFSPRDMSEYGSKYVLAVGFESGVIKIFKLVEDGGKVGLVEIKDAISEKDCHVGTVKCLRWSNGKELKIASCSQDYSLELEKEKQQNLELRKKYEESVTMTKRTDEIAKLYAKSQIEVLKYKDALNEQSANFENEKLNYEYALEEQKLEFQDELMRATDKSVFENVKASLEMNDRFEKQLEELRAELEEERENHAAVRLEFEQVKVDQEMTRMNVERGKATSIQEKDQRVVDDLRIEIQEIKKRFLNEAMKRKQVEREYDELRHLYAEEVAKKQEVELNLSDAKIEVQQAENAMNTMSEKLSHEICRLEKMVMAISLSEDSSEPMPTTTSDSISENAEINPQDEMATDLLAENEAIPTTTSDSISVDAEINTQDMMTTDTLVENEDKIESEIFEQNFGELPMILMYDVGIQTEKEGGSQVTEVDPKTLTAITREIEIQTEIYENPELGDADNKNGDEEMSRSVPVMVDCGNRNEEDKAANTDDEVVMNSEPFVNELMRIQESNEAERQNLTEEISRLHEELRIQKEKYDQLQSEFDKNRFQISIKKTTPEPETIHEEARPKRSKRQKKSIVPENEIDEDYVPESKPEEKAATKATKTTKGGRKRKEAVEAEVDTASSKVFTVNNLTTKAKPVRKMRVIKKRDFEDIENSDDEDDLGGGGKKQRMEVDDRAEKKYLSVVDFKIGVEEVKKAAEENLQETPTKNPQFAKLSETETLEVNFNPPEK
ncbi:hypothetical protein HK098_006136, partial [Nowakowskiella sp. JEL0407]